MKFLILLLASTITLSFTSSSINRVYGDVLPLKELAFKFNPKQLNLTNSLLENVALNNFLSKTDKESIRSHEDFDYFISLIVLKQFEFQKKTFHQGFDLYSMKAGNADFIVQSYVELSKLPKDIKGINSKSILDYILTNEKLKTDVVFNEIVTRINADFK